MRQEEVLIVDDEPDILDICSRSLTGDGFNVTTASASEEALCILNSRPVDILITDINMPGMSGKELLDVSKKRYPDMSAAVITGNADMDLAIETMGLGAQAFIVKPFTPSELKSTINKLVERNQLLRENLRLKALLPLLETSRKLIEKTDGDDLCKFVVAEALKGVRGDSSVVVLRQGRDFRVVASSGLSGSLPSAAAIKSKILTKCSNAKEATLIHHDELKGDKASCLVGSDVKGISALFPLKLNGREEGLLIVSKVELSDVFSEGDIEYLTILSNYLSAGLGQCKLYEKIEASLEKAKESDRVKDAFLRNMSHEFRTPLNIIINFSELIGRHKREGYTSGAHLEELAIVHDKGKELLGLFENIMDASMLEAKTLKIKRTKINLLDLLPEIVIPFEEKAKEKGVGFKLELPKTRFSVMGDSYLLSKLFNNVLDNAVKFTDKGRIEVSLVREGEEVFINIMDSGIGIDDDKRRIVFDKFRQADESTIKRFGGAGLGLYLADKITEVMGGRIDVSSPLPEFIASEECTGSLFTVRLPLCN